jgi:SAM-dependent methyltransferase
MDHGRRFFETYVDGGAAPRIVELGGMDVNGSLRSVAPPRAQYLSIDMEPGPGVDLVASDPDLIPVDDGWADVCVSSSCFEHAEFFWLTFLEAMRILKPGGLLFLNVPSNGSVHRYPVDCWRFYPDAGLALQNWARRNGINAMLLESFVGRQGLSGWNDFVCVILKDEALAGQYPKRMLDNLAGAANARRSDRSGPLDSKSESEDQSSLWHRLRRIRFDFAERRARRAGRDR